MHFAFLPRWKALNLLVSMIMLFQSKRLRTRTNCPTVHLTHQLHLNHFEESNLDPTLVSSTSMPAQSQGSQKTKQCWQCYGDQSHLRPLWLWRYRELGSRMKDLSRLKDLPRLFKLSKSCLFCVGFLTGLEKFTKCIKSQCALEVGALQRNAKR